MIIAIDWDGTLYDREAKGWSTGAKDALTLIRERGHKVIIHSCNRAKWIRQELNEAGIAVDGIWGEDQDDDVGKPQADLYIDNAAIRHESWPSTMRQLEGIL